MTDEGCDDISGFLSPSFTPDSRHCTASTSVRGAPFIPICLMGEVSALVKVKGKGKGCFWNHISWIKAEMDPVPPSQMDPVVIPPSHWSAVCL